MCLAVPGEVVEIDGDRGIVDFGGAKREAQLDLVEGVSIGDYVLIHTGYAIQVLAPEEAEEMLDAWEEVAEARSEVKV